MKITMIEAQEAVKQVAYKLGLADVEILIDDACVELEVDGLADIKNSRIYLSPEQTDLVDTVKHELCHLAAKRHGHGKKWKELMKKVSDIS
jgi:predicted metal-dependent hydrolase